MIDPKPHPRIIRPGSMYLGLKEFAAARPDMSDKEIVDEFVNEMDRGIEDFDAEVQAVWKSLRARMRQVEAENRGVEEVESAD